MSIRTVQGAAIAMAALAAIVGAAVGGDWRLLHYVCKPLTTLLILWVVVSATNADHRYRWRILAGLCFSVVGDVLLMLPGDHFVAGLLAFLLAHVFYIAAFLPGVRLSGALPVTLLLAAYAAINVAGLWPRLPSELRLPVLVYVVVLALMAAAALVRWRQMPAGAARVSARWAGIGGVLFIASDSLLAWDRFAGVVPQPALLILATYYLAQWCIACSVSASANRAR